MIKSSIQDLLTDVNRFAAVTSAAFPTQGGVVLRWLKGTERLGEPFLYEVKLASPDPIQNFAKIPGQSLTVGLKLKGTATRFFNGIVTRFQYLGFGDTERLHYAAEVRPWFSLLDWRRNSRIFQNKTSVEIISLIFREHNGKFKNLTSGRFPKRIFCVQYDETDFAFVSRLMEQDGIYYYFEHTETQHDLVLVDDPARHKLCTPDTVETHLNLKPARNLHKDDLILHWEETVSMQSDTVVLRDYDHEKPGAPLEAKARVPAVKIGGIPPRKSPAGTSRSPAGAPVMAAKTMTAAGKNSPLEEVFLYPGRYTQTSDGEFYARIHAEERACNAYRARVASTARQVTTGSIFKAANPFYYGDLGARPRPTERFLAVAQEFRIVGDVGSIGEGEDLVTDQSGEPFLYHSMVEILPATTQYRPPRRTAAPVIQGPQTAVVVGSPGETISTDKYARIKVQFHWDREGKNNESSSCWIRVAQTWAGKGFGGLVNPRVGQEVVVAFIHGNPDWPLVTGVVYNAANLPPETLPGNQTRSTFRTHTDRGAVDAYNELRFEDRRGQEEVYLKAQKDHNVEVIDNYNIKVGTQYLLTSAAPPAAAIAAPQPSVPGLFDSRIEVTPESIRMVVRGRKGPQIIQISEEGIAIIGATIGLMGIPPNKVGSIVSMPPLIPGTTPVVMKAVREAQMDVAGDLAPPTK